MYNKWYDGEQISTDFLPLFIFYTLPITFSLPLKITDATMKPVYNDQLIGQAYLSAFWNLARWPGAT